MSICHLSSPVRVDSLSRRVAECGRESAGTPALLITRPITLARASRILVLHACKVETNRFSDYLPLYQSGEATLGSDEYHRYDVYSRYYSCSSRSRSII